MKHGMWGTRVYKMWHNMLQRCRGKYKERGIAVINEWRDFETFYEWAKKAGYKDDLSLDRADNNGDYCPDNCRWVTPSVQTRNTRKIWKNNTSGYRGVSKTSTGKKWRAYVVVVDNRQKYIGAFDTPLQAAKARDKFIIDNGYEHTLNFKHAMEYVEENK